MFQKKTEKQRNKRNCALHSEQTAKACCVHCGCCSVCGFALDIVQELQRLTPYCSRKRKEIDERRCGDHQQQRKALCTELRKRTIHGATTRIPLLAYRCTDRLSDRGCWRLTADTVKVALQFLRPCRTFVGLWNRSGGKQFAISDSVYQTISV